MKPRAIEVAGDHQRRVVRPVVRRVKRARVLERDAVERPLEPFGRQAVGMGVPEQETVRDHVDDRLGLITPLPERGAPIADHAMPVRFGEPRAQQHVGGDGQRRLEARARSRK